MFRCYLVKTYPCFPNITVSYKHIPSSFTIFNPSGNDQKIQECSLVLLDFHSLYDYQMSVLFHKLVSDVPAGS